MAKKINLGPTNPPAAPMPTGVHGTLPIATGKIVPKSLTASEQAMLTSLNIGPGEEVPGNLPTLLAEAQAAARQSVAQAPPPMPLSTPPLKLPEAIALDRLPPEKQAEIRAAIAETRRMAALQASMPSLPGDMDPGLRAAIELGDQVATAAYDPPIVDDRQSPTYADDNSPKPEPVATLDEAPPCRPYCTRCGFPTDKVDTVEPTIDDKRTFLAAFLGGRPWRKQFSLFDGALEVTLRQLTPEEIDLCHQQCARQEKRGEVQTRHDANEIVSRYQLMLQLQRMVTDETVLADLPETLADWEVPHDPENTKLMAISQYLYKNVLTTDSQLRIVARFVVQFNDLVTKLEANVENPDFYRGIGRQR